jgi:hypothetical protein
MRRCRRIWLGKRSFFQLDDKLPLPRNLMLHGGNPLLGFR